MSATKGPSRNEPGAPERAPPAVGGAPDHLRRSIGFLLLVGYGVGTIVGAGIYVLVGEVIERAGPAAPLSFIIAGGVAALTGLSYAELSSRFPEAAGAATYAWHGFRSKLAARAVGAAAAFVGVISAASIARGSAFYLQHFIDAPPAVLASGVILVFGAIACLAVRQSVAVAAAISAVEVAGLLLVIAVGAPSLPALEKSWTSLVPNDGAGLGGLMAGAFMAFFAYAGFEAMANMAEETRNPRRTMPRAIIAALAIAGTLYSLVVLVVLVAVPERHLSSTDTPLLLVFSQNGWPSPWVISAVAVIATTNGVLVEILMVSRLLYGMARHGWAPAWLEHVAPATQTPLRATMLAGAVALALAAVAPVEALVDATSTLLLLLFAAVNLALWRLHGAAGHVHVGYAAPRWVPPAGCILSLAMIGARFAA